MDNLIMVDEIQRLFRRSLLCITPVTVLLFGIPTFLSFQIDAVYRHIHHGPVYYTIYLAVVVVALMFVTLSSGVAYACYRVINKHAEQTPSLKRSKQFTIVYYLFVIVASGCLMTAVDNRVMSHGGYLPDWSIALEGIGIGVMSTVVWWRKMQKI